MFRSRTERRRATRKNCPSPSRRFSQGFGVEAMECRLMLDASGLEVSPPDLQPYVVAPPTQLYQGVNADGTLNISSSSEGGLVLLNSYSLALQRTLTFDLSGAGYQSLGATSNGGIVIIDWPAQPTPNVNIGVVHDYNL